MVPADAIGRARCSSRRRFARRARPRRSGEREARAKECTNPLVNTCINSDTYWPNPGPTRFATVGGTETVGEGQVGFGLVATYLSRPVVLRVASPGPGGSDQYVVDNQVTGNFLFAYGVTDRLQLDFALPVTFVQIGRRDEPAHRRRAAARHGRPRPALRLRLRARPARPHLPRRPGREGPELVVARRRA